MPPTKTYIAYLLMVIILFNKLRGIVIISVVTTIIIPMKHFIF